MVGAAPARARFEGCVEGAIFIPALSPGSAQRYPEFPIADVWLVRFGGSRISARLLPGCVREKWERSEPVGTVDARAELGCFVRNGACPGFFRLGWTRRVPFAESGVFLGLARRPRLDDWRTLPC